MLSLQQLMALTAHLQDHHPDPTYLAVLVPKSESATQGCILGLAASDCDPLRQNELSGSHRSALALADHASEAEVDDLGTVQP